MKLVGTTNDALGVDTRSRDATKSASDGSANDNNSPPFDGVLAEVQGDANKSTQAGPTKAANASASADATSADTLPNNAATMNQLIGLLAKGAAAGAAALDTATDTKGGGAAKGSDASDDDQGAVGSLLKRMAKDSSAADPQSSATSPGTPTDLISLMLGAGATALVQGVQAAGGSAKGAPQGAAGSSAGPATTDKLSAADTPETIISNISVSTHLAPATGPQSKAIAANDPKTAGRLSTDTAPQEGVSAIASLAGGAHDRGDDTGGASHHDADPSATALGATSSLLSTSFGATRSIATAIGELAANTASAATVPSETAKPTVGVARTLTLQMSPADLGTVGIRLHVTGQTLDVQLSFSNAETMGMVSRDRDTLSSALQDQNYQVNSLVIQDGGASASSGGNNAATQGDTSGSNPRSDRQPSGGDSGMSNDGRQGRDTDRPTREDRRPDGQSSSSSPVVADSRSGSLFV